ncbi:MAG TPA: DUF2231 domain-containing protein [Tepidisphaeraceae bacterium]|nr:DUF2231 domain-containing protein [Tepidisphaeraceae bacterium]
MTNRIRWIGILLGITIGTTGSAIQAAQVPPAVPDEVRLVFSAKCGQCHSERLTNPKGHFGYVTNLRRVAGNSKILVPFDAERSKLWQEIEDEDMPPDNAKAGPLTDAEKGLIRWWIDAGAPAPQTSSSDPAPVAQTPRRPMARGERLLRFAGRFHVVVVHFPIALLVAAALAEGWFMWLGRSGTSEAVRYCVLLGAIGAVAAAALGWVRAPFVGFAGAGQTLLLHRWAGTAAGGLAVIATVLSERDVLRSRKSGAFRAALFLCALLVGVAGHLGGTLVHGDGFFTW